MAKLKDIYSGALIPMLNRHLIGRSRRCDHIVRDNQVSGEHAIVAWSGQGWRLRDLNSRNGTWLDGRRLGVGEVCTLVTGQTFSLGSAESGLQFLDDGPPEPYATQLDGSDCQIGVDGVLALPSDNAPEVTLSEDGRGWELVCGGNMRLVEDQEEIPEAGGWRLRLPATLAPTADAEALLDALSLIFSVSLDEEHVHLAAILGQRQIDLRSRAHHYMLLTLARIRERDLHNDIPPEEQGWIHQEDLAQMMRVSDNYINLAIYRVRRQLKAAGIVGAEGVVERRNRTRQMRLGIAAFQIKQGR